MTEVRRYMEAAVEKLSPAKAQQMAKSLLQGQGKGKEQVQKVAQELMDWSNQMRGRMTDMVRREVARQLKSMGAATKDEVEALKARVRVLEREAGTTSATKTPAKRSASTKASTGKPAAAKTPTARRSPGAASDKGGS